MSRDAGRHRDHDPRGDGRSPTGRRGGWAPALPALLLAAAVLVACTNPLDVDNPNKLTEEDVDAPTAMSSVVNGAQSAVTRGLQGIGGVYATATDELTWIGSRDAWQQLDQGRVDDPVNEFTDFAFPFVAEARFMADRAISQGELFQSEGTLSSPRLLARAYLYGAIIYTAIAEQFDDFVLPEDPQEAVPPVGEDNMDQLFATAIDHATSGLDVARSEGFGNLEEQLLAVRARANHAWAVWEKLNPPGSTPADPLVNPSSTQAQAARGDAEELLALVDDDWRFQLDFEGVADIVVGDLSLALQVNERGELQIGPAYVDVNPDNTTDITAITLDDPIDGVTDPVVAWKIAEFHDDDDYEGIDEDAYVQHDQFAPMTIASAREMHLIVAEHELAASGDNATFRGHVNAVRQLDGLSDYEGQISPEAILEHERRVNLFMMFRRLTDMYRFGTEDQLWGETSAAVREPGTMLPITITEIRSNPNVDG